MMAGYVENLNGFGANTDIGSVGSFVRNAGTVGSAVVNADGFFDIVSATPNSKISYPVVDLDNSMECTTAQAAIGGNYYPVGVSVTSGGNGIYARIIGSNFIELAKIVTDVITPLVGSGGTIINSTYATGTRTTGDRLKVQRIGDTVKVFFNDVEKFSVDVSGQGVSRTTNTGMYIRSTTGTDLFTQFTMEGIPAYAITTANGGNAIPVGASGIVATVAGFTNPITSGTLGGKALTITDGVLNDIGFTVSNYVDDTTYYNPSSSQTLSLSDGTNSANLSVPTTVPTGKSVVTLASPNTVDMTYPTANLDFTPVDGDKLIYVTVDCTIDATGKLTTDSEKETEIIHWRLSDGKTYLYQFTINEYGVLKFLSGVSLGFGLGFGI